MSIAIRAENLGKRYFLGHAAKPKNYRTLRESLVEGAHDALSRLRRRNDSPQVEEFWAVKDLNFEVHPGEVVGIIGRNGAGKSTLLKILSRITRPTTGRVEIFGRVGSLLEVGTGFHPELTGRENIYLNGSILGMKRLEIARRFDEIVAFAEVEKFLDLPVKRYSSGMYVRLAFAVAAHLEPEILIIDEVLAVGDAQFQARCFNKINQVARDGRTILFVSHSMSALVQMCQRVYLLEQGRLSFEGPARQVVAHYLNKQQAQGRSDFDLAQASRNANVALNGRAKLLKCQFRETGVSEPNVIPYANPIILDIDFSVTETITGVSFSSSILDSSGYSFASSWSNDTSSPIQMNPGDHTCRMTLPDLVLSPGRYYLDLGIQSKSGFEDYVSEAATFEVIPTQKSVNASVHQRLVPVIPRSIFNFMNPSISN